MVAGVRDTGPAGAGLRVGVLALQGDFARHAAAFESLGATVLRVTGAADLEGLDALALPGGESTTMLRLIDANGLRAPLEAFVADRPVFGTCAGVILLGRGGAGLPAPPFGVLDVEVERNAYGRQVDSFTAPVDAPSLGEPAEGVFIRAPRIRSVGPGVQIVATLSRTGAEPEIVGVREGRRVGLTFHPELTADSRFHRWFLESVVRAHDAAPRAARRPRAEVA
jgi:5'-phosphate synthase pdxT subunit